MPTGADFRPFASLPLVTGNRVLDIRLAPVRIGEIEVFAAGHAEFLHQPPATGITGHGERDDLRRGEGREAPIHHRAHRFVRIAPPPAILAHQPADLEVLRVGRKRVSDAAQPAMADHLTGRAFFHDHEAVALGSEPRARGSVLGRNHGARLHPAEVPHHRRRVEQRHVRIKVTLADLAQHQPVGD